MKKLKIKSTVSRFIKCHILCARSAFIEKNAMAALQDSFNDLSKFYILNLCYSVNCFNVLLCFLNIIFLFL